MVHEEAAMFKPIMTSRSLLVAEAWKELFEEEGIPCTLYWPDPRSRNEAEATCHILVPSDRLHVAQRSVSKA